MPSVSTRVKSAPVGETSVRFASLKASTSKKRASAGVFSLLAWLPDEQVKSVKDLIDGVTAFQVKEECELFVGLPATSIDLQLTDGTTVDDDHVFRLDVNVTTNMLIKVKYKPLFESLRCMIEDCSVFELEGFIEKHQDQQTLLSLLFLCSFTGKTTLCQSIFKQGGQTLRGHTTPAGNTPLHAACSKDKVSTAMYLCNFGYDMNQVNKRKLSPLDCALLHGAVTCERKLRLSQWKRRSQNLEGTTPREASNTHSLANAEPGECTSNDDSSSSYTESYTAQPTTIKWTITDLGDNNQKSSTNTTRVTSSQNQRLTTPSLGQAGSRPTSRSLQSRELLSENKFAERCLVKRRAVSAGSRTITADEKHLNGRNIKLCREMAGDEPSKQDGTATKTEVKRERFTVTRPQYTQYIKSATGIIEEDYFADIFPGLDDEKPRKKGRDEQQNTRSFDEQLARNQRIFRKMFRESGLLKSSDNETDSEDELKRKILNDRAVRRWKKKKISQKEEEEKKKLLRPANPDDQVKKRQCLDSLVMIGDTSRDSRADNSKHTNTQSTDMYAYQNYARDKSGQTKSVRIQSAGLLHQRHIDPNTYHEWLDQKQTSTRSPSAENNRKERMQPTLKKNIEYNEWLQRANRKIAKALYIQKRDARQKKDFEEWIAKLKEEVGTFDYWKRNKEEKLRQEKEEQKQREQQRQEKEREDRRRREAEAKVVYREWVLKKETLLLKREQRRLDQEKQKLGNSKS